jgi:hypothetical protein
LVEEGVNQFFATTTVTEYGFRARAKRRAPE